MGVSGLWRCLLSPPSHAEESNSPWALPHATLERRSMMELFPFAITVRKHCRDKHAHRDCGWLRVLACQTDTTVLSENRKWKLHLLSASRACQAFPTTLLRVIVPAMCANTNVHTEVGWHSILANHTEAARQFRSQAIIFLCQSRACFPAALGLTSGNWLPSALQARSLDWPNNCENLLTNLTNPTNLSQLKRS